MRLPLRSSLAAAALGLAFPVPAPAAEQTLTFRTNAIAIRPYEAAQNVQLAASPKADGYVVGMEADIVDAAGNRLPASRVMLHHVVFAKLGAPDYTCRRFFGFDGRSSTTASERFYGAGEERMRLVLPAGYGYPNRGADLWGLVYMLMNHTRRAQTVYIEYTVRYVTGEQLTPVRPVWLDVRNCRADPIFDVPGTGPRSSTYSRRVDFRLPESGRLVAGGGHLHGGGVRLELANATCGRELFASLPTWAAPEPGPAIHELGPIKMSSFTSSTGIPVAAGDVLRLTAVYDNDVPHTRVMGIMLVYLVAGEASRCPAPPPLDVDLGSPGPPPRIVLSLLRQPEGRLVRNARRAWVGDYAFSPERVLLPRGATFTWRLVGPSAHDVTLVNGPVGLSSPTTPSGTFRYRFTRPGVYRFHCSIHPGRMTQVVVVR